MRNRLLILTILLFSILLVSCGIKQNSYQDEKEKTESVESDSKKTDIISDEGKNNDRVDERVDEGNNNDLDSLENQKAEKILLQFQMRDSAKIVTLSIEEEKQEYLVYRFGAPEQVEFEFPKDLKDSWNQFIYTHYFRGGGPSNEGIDLIHLSFQNDGYQYTIYEEYVDADEDGFIGIKVLELSTGKETDLVGDYHSKVGTLLSLEDNEKIQKE